MKPTTRLAEAKDLIHVAKHMRECDRNEIQASAGVEPLEGLVMSLQASPVTWVAEAGGTPFAVFGCSRVDESTGVPWLLATDDLYKHKHFIARESIKWRDRLQKEYKILTNFVDVRNQDTIDWLKWLGFEFPNIINNYGHEGRPFVQFIRNR